MGGNNDAVVTKAKHAGGCIADKLTKKYGCAPSTFHSRPKGLVQQIAVEESEVDPGGVVRLLAQLEQKS